MTRFEEGAGYARWRLEGGMSPKVLRGYAEKSRDMGMADAFDDGILHALSEWEEDDEPA